MTATALKDRQPFGSLLRNWRQRRRLSQLALGLDTDVSARHISFLESGRAKPSRVMVVRLADGLDMPLVDRNLMLTSAGFAPRYTHAPLDDDSLAPALDAMRQLMNAHTPYPALLLDQAGVDRVSVGVNQRLEDITLVDEADSAIGFRRPD